MKKSFDIEKFDISGFNKSYGIYSTDYSLNKNTVIGYCVVVTNNEINFTFYDGNTNYEKTFKTLWNFKKVLLFKRLERDFKSYAKKFSCPNHTYTNSLNKSYYGIGELIK